MADFDRQTVFTRRFLSHAECSTDRRPESGGMILRGKRNLTLAHVRKLTAHFKVGAGAFL